MKLISREALAYLRQTYPAGTRVELISMDDLQAPPTGTLGTCLGVDDTGSVMVAWDNGASLNALWQVDVIRKVKDSGNSDQGVRNEKA